MAILKKIDSGAGYTIEYWHISDIDLKIKNNLKVVLSGYINKKARTDGLKAVQSRTLTIPVAELDLNGNLRQQIYDWAIRQEVKEVANKFIDFNRNANAFFADAKSDI